MLILKIYLFAGLVFHKAVWEIMKRQQRLGGDLHHQGVSLDSAKAHGGLVTRLVKTVKVAILLGIAVQIFLPDILPISSESLILRIIGTLTFSAGLWIAIGSRTALGANWSDIEAAKVSDEHVIVSRGPYRFIRHPIYVGDLLLLFGLELALNSWFVLGVLALAPVVLLQAVREEKKLARSLPDYEAYCSATKRFIPFVV
jgi:protein-S-isoprenylcysteine O-methyltransferase Ste14